MITSRSSGPWSPAGWVPIGGACMKSVGIREAKARLSELAWSAANGEPIVLTHHGELLAVITSIEDGGASQADGRYGRFGRLGIQEALNVTVQSVKIHYRNLNSMANR